MQCLRAFGTVPLRPLLVQHRRNPAIVFLHLTASPPPLGAGAPDLAVARNAKRWRASVRPLLARWTRSLTMPRSQVSGSWLRARAWCACRGAQLHAIKAPSFIDHAATFAMINGDQTLFYMANPENNRKASAAGEHVWCAAKHTSCTLAAAEVQEPRPALPFEQVVEQGPGQYYCEYDGTTLTSMVLGRERGQSACWLFRATSHAHFPIPHCVFDCFCRCAATSSAPASWMRAASLRCRCSTSRPSSCWA